MLAVLQNTKAIRMIKGRGDNAVTAYSCGAIDRAKREGVDILIVTRDKKTGEKVETLVKKTRPVHRDLLAVFGKTHKLAGQGKIIDLKAFPHGDMSCVVGAQHVHPHRDNGSYSVIIEVLKKSIGFAALSQLRGKVITSVREGTHILWEGRRNKNESVVCSDWFTKEEIWEMSRKFCPGLFRNLGKSKSGCKGVAHKSAKEKFFYNIDVIRRATCVVHVIDGKRVLGGGVTPYAALLEQCGFALDKQYLTYGVKNGEEVGQEYYRLAIGRSEPYILRADEWKYEDLTSTIAFKDSAAKQAVRKLFKKA